MQQEKMEEIVRVTEKFNTKIIGKCFSKKIVLLTKIEKLTRC